MSMFRKIAAGAFCAVMVSSVCSAGNLLSGRAAEKKFPAKLQSMGIYDAKWSEILPGVEYSFARFTNFYSNVPDDLHVIRVDYPNAPVAMKIVNNTPSRKYTSQVAAENKALFSFNGDMERKGTDKDEFPGKPYPYYGNKADGKVFTMPGGGKSAGLVFNSDKSFDFSGGGGTFSLDDWENLISCEGTLHNGVNGMEKFEWAKKYPGAGFWLIGMTPEKILYFFVIDGRRKGIAPGINYYNTAELMKEFGCTEGMLYDGGGSVTLVMRDDLVPARDFAWTQHPSEHGKGYTTMNFTSYNGARLVERAVVNQLMFVPLEVEKKPSSK